MSGSSPEGGHESGTTAAGAGGGSSKQHTALSQPASARPLPQDAAQHAHNDGASERMERTASGATDRRSVHEVCGL